MKVKLVKSLIGRNERQLETARSLGLKRIGDVAEVKDTPAGRGQVAKLRFLLEVIEEGAKQ